MKPTLLSIVLLCLCEITSHGQDMHWQLKMSDDFQFRAAFPGKVTQEKITLDTLLGSGSGLRIASESDDMKFEVSVVNYTKADIAKANNSKMMERLADSFVAEVGCTRKAIDNAYGHFGYYGGWITSCSTTSEQIDFMLFVEHDRLYRTVSRFPLSSPNERDAKEIVKSFQAAFKILPLKDNLVFN